MTLENRYYVLKRRDLDTALDAGLINANDVDTLRRIHQACAAGRDKTGRAGQNYVVVESDWPIYSAVVNLVEALAENRTPVAVEKMMEIGQRICMATGKSPADLVAASDKHFLTILRDLVVEELGKVAVPDPQAEARANTERAMALRSQELNEQEARLQQDMRRNQAAVDEAWKALETAGAALESPEGYDSLARVLREVMHQAAIGKGHQRHADGKPFDQQPILALSRKYHSPVGLLFQIQKKLDEYERLDGIARRRELLGAIVYMAALIIFDQEDKGYDLMHESKLSGVGYLVRREFEA